MFYPQHNAAVSKHTRPSAVSNTPRAAVSKRARRHAALPSLRPLPRSLYSALPQLAIPVFPLDKTFTSP